MVYICLLINFCYGLLLNKIGICCSYLIIDFCVKRLVVDVNDLNGLYYLS